MKLTIIILITIIFSIFTLQTSALTFNNFSSGGVGAINTGDGYYNDDGSNYGYSGSRNVYVVTENNQIWMFEPISYSGGGTAFQRINSSSGTLNDAVVHAGYLYFIDGTTLKKKKTRNDGSVCESSDTTAGGCISTISTGVTSPVLRVYNSNIYFIKGQVLFTLDDTDSAQSVITIPATVTVPNRGYTSWTVSTNNSNTALYIWGSSGGARRLLECEGIACSTVYSTTFTSDVMYSTLYSTTNYIYDLNLCSGCAGLPSVEQLVRISNGTISSVDYITTNTELLDNRVYVGGLSTIGLAAQTTTTYETFNSNEIGQSSLQLSQGSGIVEYVNKEISVQNPTYYNDSTIPFDINLKFIISQENLTNYQSTMQWHAVVLNPSGIQVSDGNIAITCDQVLPWWDVGGIFDVLLNLLGNAPWACDGTQTIQMTPNTGQFWDNGTWTVELTENIPGTTSILSTDTWSIINQSTPSSGIINPPISCPTCGLGTGGTINTNTSLQIIQVFSMVAFWGFIIWLGIVGSIIAVMAKSPSGVNGMAVIVVSWLSAIFIALVGLFDPFKIYIIVLSTIIAAVLFRLGKNATTTED